MVGVGGHEQLGSGQVLVTGNGGGIIRGARRRRELVEKGRIPRHPRTGEQALELNLM